MEAISDFFQSIFIGFFRFFIGGGLLFGIPYLAFKWRDLDEEEKPKRLTALITLILLFFFLPAIVHWFASLSLFTDIIILAVGAIIIFVLNILITVGLACRADQAYQDLHDIANYFRRKND